MFAVDEITDDLKRAVEYLNAHTVDSTTAVVLELEYRKVGDVDRRGTVGRAAAIRVPMREYIDFASGWIPRSRARRGSSGDTTG